MFIFNEKTVVRYVLIKTVNLGITFDNMNSIFN